MKASVPTLLSFLLFMQTPVFADAESNSLRTVQTQGVYEAEVVPDQAIVSFGIHTSASALNPAVTDNDSRTKAVLALAPSFGIRPEDVQTASVHVGPKFKHDTQGTKQIGFGADRQVTFYVHDLSKFEELVGSALAAGATSVDDLTFKTSKLEDAKVRAQKEAARVARQKAQALATELGATLGKIRTITDQSMISNSINQTRGYYLAPALQGATNGTIGPQGVEYTSLGSPKGTFAPGHLTISSSVTVVFDLL